jgi:hypothetical protein
MKKTIIVGVSMVAVGYCVWTIARNKNIILNPFGELEIDWNGGDLFGMGVVDDDK